MERKKKKAPSRLSSKGQKTSKGPTVAVKPSLPSRDEMKQLKTGQYVVGIGASAGGLEALELLFSHMPPDSGMSFVLIPHLSPERKSIMAELLQRHTSMNVAQAEEGMRVMPNSVYIIPPNRDMSIEGDKLHLLEPSAYHGIRHPIDFFFRSLAKDRGERAVCIILSGTGTEGTLGLQAIKGEGGLVLAQEVKTAKYDGMPASAIATGLVDYVLAPEKMPELLLRYTKSTYARAFKPQARTERPTEALQKIFSMIRVRMGHDFSQYKLNTIVRRIEKRMVLHQIDTLDNYVSYLRNNEYEVEALANELLIRVTSFFRDPESFDILKQKAFPRLFKNKVPGGNLRIWVPGCSTGEEAYSLAMVALEAMHEHNVNYTIQVFATDIDSRAVEIARAGLYPESITVDVSPARLARFFIRKNQQYQIRDNLREMVVFAVQNLIKDPPFSKMDMISCRNLLIYLGPALQKKALPLFHYSLNPEGILFLGSSETVGDTADLFSVLDKRWKIFSANKVEANRAAAADLRYPVSPARRARTEIVPEGMGPANVAVSSVMEKLLIERYAPPSCMVNDNGDILFFHGRTGRFLEPASGKAALNILEMAREGLRIELRTAMRKALDKKKDVVLEGLQIRSNGSHRSVNLEVRYVKQPEHLQGLLLIAFNEQAVPKSHKKAAKATAKAAGRAKAGADERVSALEYELKSTKERLQTAIEELETSNEELKSLNEEMQSSNEELQSTNEELETSREELQSVNEELVTVNTELQNKIEELSDANNDIVNLLESTLIATIFLDSKLRIKRFTPTLADLINIIQTDVGRPLGDISVKLDYPDLVADAEETVRTLATKERTVRHLDGRWFLARVLPYRTVENVIDGVVITFIDITGQKRAQALQDALTYAEGIVDTVREPLLVLDADLRVMSANKSFYEIFGVSSEETVKKLVYELGSGQWNVPGLRILLEEILPKSAQFRDFVVDHEFPGVGRKKMLLNARRINQNEVGTQMILVAMEDVTGRGQRDS
ncbi:MAG: chemotaxis protein CheB [Nitrospirota bacterium]